ncbi:hypothetical protein EJ08DRAFT_715238 [Tothia fuscella]|uniref:F-box domain-containing protein n=1 Tax=Tothia fuscella TaxID=1048955 RepID=A0A9P4TYR8_9PEZI|nr:hypothetical protein EJ08DRAFT_715238 [Tothia fuscella]
MGNQATKPSIAMAPTFDFNGLPLELKQMVADHCDNKTLCSFRLASSQTNGELMYNFRERFRSLSVYMYQRPERGHTPELSIALGLRSVGDNSTSSINNQSVAMLAEIIGKTDLPLVREVKHIHLILYRFIELARDDRLCLLTGDTKQFLDRRLSSILRGELCKNLAGSFPELTSISFGSGNWERGLGCTIFLAENLNLDSLQMMCLRDQWYADSQTGVSAISLKPLFEFVPLVLEGDVKAQLEALARRLTPWWSEEFVQRPATVEEIEIVQEVENVGEVDDSDNDEDEGAGEDEEILEENDMDVYFT